MKKARRQEPFDELETTDYVLATLYYSGRALTKLKIMKILAAFAKLTGKEDQLDYAPYRMGLYSPEVNATIRELAQAGILEQTRYGYRLTPRGLRYALQSVQRLERLARDDAELLKRLTRSMEKLRREELLLMHYVIICDEPCREVSEEWKKIEKRRKEIALSMYRRGLATWRLAARLAGMQPDEFAEYAETRGVRVGYRLSLSDIKAAEKDADLLRPRHKRRSNR